MAKPAPAKRKFVINMQVVPADGNMVGKPDPEIRTPDDDRVCPAYYNVYDKEHGHHLKDADRDVEMSIWSWGEQGREIYTEDCYGDDTIGPSNGKKKKGNPY